jgi:hypothetical protein
MLDSAANRIKLTFSQEYDQNATSIVALSGGSSLPAAPFNMTWCNATGLVSVVSVWSENLVYWVEAVE